MRIKLTFITVSIIFLFTFYFLPAVDVFGHVITSDTAENVVGADVTLEGNDQTFQTITNDSGDFYFQDVDSGFTYTLTINYTGYVLYIDDNVEVGENNVDLGEIILIEIPYPVSQIYAQENHDGNALITWCNPDENDRELEYYNLHRLLDGDQENPGNWEEIALGITDTLYEDVTWSSVPPGVWRYAVTAIYTGEVDAEPGFSNMLGWGPIIPINMIITTNNGESPEGAVVVLSNIDGDPDHVYSATVPSDGVFTFYIFYFGTYDLEVTLPYYYDHYQYNIPIYGATSISVELNEEILPPIDPMITNYGSFIRFSWTPPSPFCESYSVYVDGSTPSSTPYPFYDLYYLPGGFHTLGVSANYSSGNGSAIIYIEVFVDVSESALPLETKMLGSYPNPFNPETSLSYQVSEISDINISIYNSLGQLVKTLVSDVKPAGEYSIKWLGTDSNRFSVSSGVYYFHLSVNDKTEQVMKCLLIK